MSVICLQIGLGYDHLTPERKRDKVFQCLNVKRPRLRFSNSPIHFGHFDKDTSLTIVGLVYVFVIDFRDWKSYKFCQFWIIELSDSNICLNFAVHTALEQTLTFIYSYKRQSLTLSEENSKIKRLQELLWPRSLQRQHFRLVDGNYGSSSREEWHVFPWCLA